MEFWLDVSFYCLCSALGVLVSEGGPGRIVGRELWRRDDELHCGSHTHSASCRTGSLRARNASLIWLCMYWGVRQRLHCFPAGQMNLSSNNKKERKRDKKSLRCEMISLHPVSQCIHCQFRCWVFWEFLVGHRTVSWSFLLDYSRFVSVGQHLRVLCCVCVCVGFIKRRAYPKTSCHCSNDNFVQFTITVSTAWLCRAWNSKRVTNWQ